MSCCIWRVFFMSFVGIFFVRSLLVGGCVWFFLINGMFFIMGFLEILISLLCFIFSNFFLLDLKFLIDKFIGFIGDFSC